MNLPDVKHTGGLQRADEAGASLIEVMIVVAIMSVVSLGLASLVVDMQKPITLLRQRQELVELKTTLLRQFAKSDVCTWQLAGNTIDASMATTESSPSPTVINVAEIRHGLNVTSALIAKAGDRLPGDSNLIVDTINFTKIYATGNPNEYTGSLIITFVAASMAGVMKPLQIQQIIRTQTGPPAALPIESCASAQSLLTSNSPVVEFTYVYPPAGGFWAQSVTATCPAGSLLLTCLGCKGTGCTPSVAAMYVAPYNLIGQTGQIEFYLTSTTDTSCLGTVNANFDTPVDYSSAIVVSTHNQVFRFMARCLRL